MRVRPLNKSLMTTIQLLLLLLIVLFLLNHCSIIILWWIIRSRDEIVVYWHISAVRTPHRWGSRRWIHYLLYWRLEVWVNLWCHLLLVCGEHSLFLDRLLWKVISISWADLSFLGWWNPFSRGAGLLNISGWEHTRTIRSRSFLEKAHTTLTLVFRWLSSAVRHNILGHWVCNMHTFSFQLLSVTELLWQNFIEINLRPMYHHIPPFIMTTIDITHNFHEATVVHITASHVLTSSYIILIISFDVLCRWRIL